METILFLTDTGADGLLSRPAREALRAAAELRSSLPDASLVVGLFGERTEPAAGSIGGSGAAKVLRAEHGELGVSRYATDAAAAEAIVRASGATLVLSPGTPRLARALPGVAQRVDGRIDTRITGLSGADGAPQVQRWFYRKRIVGTLSRTHRPWFLLLDAGTFEAWPEETGALPQETVPVELPDGLLTTRVLGHEDAAAQEGTIRPEADLLLVAGAGWTKKQADGQTHTGKAEELILDFLARADASLGSSKSLVDQSSEGQVVLGCLTHLHQIGQTGSTPRHAKGLATCCHGEEPHVVGWRFIGERRAVNTDAGCGWAQGKADVLYVADAFEVVAKINALLADR